jgi:hypothetical protein
MLDFPRSNAFQHKLSELVEMDAIKLILAFAPWIAFWIISLGHSMFSLQLGICVAALLVIVMGVTRLHRGAILWAGVAFFAFAVISVVWLKNSWVIHHLGFLASGTLFMATFLSILWGRPFTEDYARDHVPRELWESPSFIRGCFTITGAWGFVFLANTMVNLVKLQRPVAAGWIYEVVQLGFLALGVIFTTVFSRIARRKRGQAEPVIKK